MAVVVSLAVLFQKRLVGSCKPNMYSAYLKTIENVEFMVSGPTAFSPL